jgi:hypothetical protein
MGGSSSKTTFESLTEVAINVANEQVQKCTSTASQSQVLQIKGTKGDVKIGGFSQRQAVSIDMKCAFDNNTQSNLQAKLAQEITQMAEAKGGDITAGFGNSSSEANTNIRNLFSTNINNSSLMAAVSSTMQEQKISVEDTDGNVIIADVEQDQTARNMAEVMMSNTQYSGVLHEIATKIDQKAKSQGGGIFTNMFDMIGGIFENLKGVILAIVIAIAVAVGGGILIYGGMKAYNMMQSQSVEAAVAVPAYVPRVTRVIPPPPL